MQPQIVLPARLRSTRLSEKLLQRVGGKTILAHTYQAAKRAAGDGAPPIVAVDDRKLADEVDAFGGRWIMTPESCASGTDRIAYVADQLPEVTHFINVQSDEPEIAAEAIAAVAEALLGDETADMATVATRIRDPESLHDPSVVKIVLADYKRPANALGQGRAIYFSRACVPHHRDGDPAMLLDQDEPTYWHHLGLYAYRREFLQWFASAPPTRLEQIEKLEQLRAIDAGKKIVVREVSAATTGIDTPADLEAFRRRDENRR